MPKLRVSKDNRVIYKYLICDARCPIIESPIDVHCIPGGILDIQIQDGLICVWMFVDLNKPKTTKTFMILPTGGNEITEEQYSDLLYLKTLQRDGLIWHVFMITE